MARIVFRFMPPSELEALKKDMKEQGALLRENHRMLRKLSRYQTATFILTTVWYALLIGLPFAIYYYLIGPYVEALGFGGDYNATLHDLPGYRQFESFFGLQSEEQ